METARCEPIAFYLPNILNHHRLNPINFFPFRCRNIYKLQQALALLTENHESDLIRVKQLYELFYLTPEVISIYSI